MKKIVKYILSVCCASSVLLTGCIDETTPTNIATADQLASSSKATEALLWAMPAYANNIEVVSTSAAYDWGYGSIMHIRDVMTEEMAVISHGYDWYNAWQINQFIGERYMSTQFIWTYLWKYVQTSNNMIKTIDPTSATEVQLGYLGIGHAYRAFVYLDLARMYEFLENDGKESVNSSGNNVLNLTVPIVKETVTEAEARNNPRVKREVMYDFILSDLNLAETYLEKYSRPTKTLPNLSVVYGLKARLYMWVEDYPNAKIYARKAIDAGGFTPTTKDQWLSTTTGFNDLSTPSWMWGSQLQAEDAAVKRALKNWTAWASNEAVYGYSAAGPFLMINARTYNNISNEDFRKLSWKAPAGGALDGKNSYIDPAFGKELPEYASLKFRPGAGNTDDFKVGSASAYPLMRIEEMYFIEAEAAAHSNPSEGVALINSFMQTYRYKNYACRVTAKDDVVKEIFNQKRVEFWGEGINYFDYKRLNMPVQRGYVGTNFYGTARFNTTTRPAWMNFSIVQNEKDNNAALVGFENPDSSDCYKPWTGQ